MGKDILRSLRRKDTLNRTPQIIEFENFTISRRSPVTIADLSGGRAPKRHDILSLPELYDKLAAKPIDVLTVTDKSGREQQLMVFPPVDGLEANFVLHAAAAHKLNGLNTFDIINDWHELIEPDSDREANRQNLHRHIPGWEHFKNNGEGNKIVRLLSDFHRAPYGVTGTNQADTLVPVVRWTMNNGIPEIILDPLEPEMADAIVKTLPHKVKNAYQLDTVLGLPFLAAFSPDITIDRYGGYNPSKPSSTVQDIGPGQMMAYFFLKIAQGRMPGHEVKPERDIQQSHLLRAATEFSQSGNLPRRQKNTAKKTPAEIIRSHARKEFEGLDDTKTREFNIPMGTLSIHVEPGFKSFRRSYELSRVRIAEVTDDGSRNVAKRTIYKYSGIGTLGEHIELELRDTPDGSKIRFSTPTKKDRPFRRWNSYHRRSVQKFGINL